MRTHMRRTCIELLRHARRQPTAMIVTRHAVPRLLDLTRSTMPTRVVYVCSTAHDAARERAQRAARRALMSRTAMTTSREEARFDATMLSAEARGAAAKWRAFMLCDIRSDSDA